MDLRSGALFIAKAGGSYRMRFDLCAYIDDEDYGSCEPKTKIMDGEN